MYVKLTVPERLKDLRVERGLTLEQLAEATGPEKYVSNSRTGSAPTNLLRDVIQKLIVQQRRTADTA